MPKAKKRKIEHSSVPNVWLQWLSESDSNDEDVLQEESEHEVENFTVSDDDTASDQDIPETDAAKRQPSAIYTGRDKETKWQKTPPRNIKTLTYNIINSPGPKGAARNIHTEIDSLNLFINQQVVDLITKYTNLEIEKIRAEFERDRDARATDETEIRSVIGLLYLMGSFRYSRKNLHLLWDNSKGNGIEACYLTMSEKRFLFLLRCFNFDDFRNRDEREKLDKLAPIREIFEIMLENFQAHFLPSEYLTLDERLLAFRGTCPFKQYVPRKKARYGIKTFALVDVKTGYTMNLETYISDQPEGPFRVSNTPQDVVLRMVQPVEGTHRNITSNYLFTSVSLAKKLLEEKKLTYVGTIRKNTKELPKEFLQNKQRKERTSLFGFQKSCTIVSYCTNNQVDLLLSTKHHDCAIDPSTPDEKTPEIISFHNATITGVDLVDQLCQRSNVSRNTKRWPLVVFYDLLNVAGINALCVYKAIKSESKIKRSSFLRAVAWELIKPQMERRARMVQVSTEIRRRAEVLLNIQQSNEPPREPRTGARGRCALCGRKRSRTTRKCCSVCQKWCCNDHLKTVCVNCFTK